jgi:hypothetical protein
MIEKIEKAIEEMTDKARRCERDSQDAMRFSQAVVNLANARACLVQTRLNEEAAKK